ncbi:MAG TPA: RICIN domain-containing protein [Chitinophaga sp.]
MQIKKILINTLLLSGMAFCMPQQSIAQEFKGGAFQLENKATRLLLRPRDANNADGTQIVVYPKYDWRCLTWDITPAGYANIFTFRNYFTNKTFQPTAGVTENTPVLQAAIRPSATLQQWDVIKVEGDYYKISAHGSELVMTVEGSGTNAKVVLKKWDRSAAQLWKLLPKPEDFSG